MRMHDSKKNTKDQALDYRVLFSELIAENKFYFSSGLVIVCIFLFLVVRQFGGNFFKSKFAVKEYKTNGSLSEVLKDKPINYLSPTNYDSEMKLRGLTPVVSQNTEERNPPKQKHSSPTLQSGSSADWRINLSVPDDNGQISAISSSKVTYVKNKYIVKKGDSLASIALSVYGDRDAWVRIAQANKLASPDKIEVGMELVIPR